MVAAGGTKSPPNTLKKQEKINEWCPGADLNHRHADFQSAALPLSYPGIRDLLPAHLRFAAAAPRQGPILLLTGYRQVANTCPVTIPGSSGKKPDGAAEPNRASVFGVEFVAGGVFLNHGNGVFAVEPAPQIDIGAAGGTKRIALAVRQLLADRARHRFSQGGYLAIAHCIHHLIAARLDTGSKRGVACLAGLRQ